MSRRNVAKAAKDDGACLSCGEVDPPSGFRKAVGDKERRPKCRDCEADDRAQRRIGSDYASLKPEDFDVTVGNDGRGDKEASRQKRQEWSEAMGEFSERLAAGNLEASDGAYVARLAEQERRFGNRRIARSVSLAAAHEALALRQFKDAATEYLRGHVKPIGYARKTPSVEKPRTVCLLLSDLHLGAELGARDNPYPFGAVEEARRLEYVLRQALDFKPQYRDQTELVVLLNGDLIEGYLLHDLRDGAPLTEQKVIFWRHFRTIIGQVAAQFPRVRVFCQPGNHGRDTVRHPGRATSSKWDGHEFSMMWALREMCSGLKNVEWDLPFQAVGIVDLYGKNLLLTHGDTEVKLGDPDTKAVQNAAELAKINSTRLYGVEFAAMAAGHFHKPRNIPGRVRTVFNGALVPPNGHARTNGWTNEPCGQWLWESVEGHIIGDTRFIEVGPPQDRDTGLGSLIEPFRFEGRSA